jgi:hypothetical protein
LRILRVADIQLGVELVDAFARLEVHEIALCSRGLRLRIEFIQKRVGEAGWHYVKQRPAHDGKDFVEVVGLDERIIADRGGRQRPVTAGGVKALPWRAGLAQLDEILQRSRKEQHGCLRDEWHAWLIVLARPRG